MKHSYKIKKESDAYRLPRAFFGIFTETLMTAERLYSGYLVLKHILEYPIERNGFCSNSPKSLKSSSPTSHLDNLVTCPLFITIGDMTVSAPIL